MPIDLSVKRVPDEIADQLRERAKRNHRSLQGELRAILEDAVARLEPISTGREWTAYERSPAATLPAPSSWRIAPQSESALMIRQDRDGRTFGVRDLYDFVLRLGQGTPDESTRWIREDRSSDNPARRRSAAEAELAKPAKPSKTAKR